MIEQEDYGMFTDAGDQMVAGLIAFAKKHMLTERSVLGMIHAVSETEVYQEVLDTVVRERISAALNLESIHD